MIVPVSLFTVKPKPPPTSPSTFFNHHDKFGRACFGQASEREELFNVFIVQHVQYLMANAVLEIVVATGGEVIRSMVNE